MHWLFLLFAIGAFVLGISTPQVWLLVLCLIVALVFVMLWIRGLYIAKFGDGSNTEPRPLHPSELQHMREQLQKKQAESAAPPSTPDP